MKNTSVGSSRGQFKTLDFSQSGKFPAFAATPSFPAVAEEACGDVAGISAHPEFQQLAYWSVHPAFAQPQVVHHA